MRTRRMGFPSAALMTICLLLLCCSLPTSSHRLSSLGAWTTPPSSRRFLSLSTTHQTFLPQSQSQSSFSLLTTSPSLRISNLLSTVKRVRGGSPSASISPPPPQQRTRDAAVGDLTIFLTSNFGLSSFLRKTQKFKIPRNASVTKLKEVIQEKFPGHPPTGLQKLYLESKIMQNDEILGHLTNKILLPIQLDLMSGTMLYNKTSVSLSKAIDAYISLSVHEAYLSNKLTEVITSPSSLPSKRSSSLRNMVPDSIKYRLLYKKLNESFYEAHGSEIKAALEAEENPSMDSDDTHMWQSATIPATLANTGVSSPSSSSIKDIIRRELLLNDKDIAKLTYWSCALMLFGLLGTESGGSQALALAAIPLLWVAGARSVRLYLKVLRNVVLAMFSSVDILRRLLPAPLQVIASESGRWRTDPLAAEDSVAGDYDSAQWLQKKSADLFQNVKRVLLDSVTIHNEDSDSDSDSSAGDGDDDDNYFDDSADDE